MSKIRADLVGTVFVLVEGGSPLVLVAGSDIPDGVVVGNHLLDDPSAGSDIPDGVVVGPDDDGAPKAPRGNASRDTWAAYAESLGLDVSEDLDRDDIKALVKAQD